MTKLTIYGSGVDAFTEAFNKEMHAKKQLERDNTNLKRSNDSLGKKYTRILSEKITISAKLDDLYAEIERLSDENRQLKQEILFCAGSCDLQSRVDTL